MHKLVGNLQLSRKMAAAVQRSVLTLRLAVILAVHHRIPWDTENRLWDLVSEKMGARRAEVQSKALGLGGEDFEDTCEAALELFTLAASEVRTLLNERQYEVAAHACRLTGGPLEG